MERSILYCNFYVCFRRRFGEGPNCFLSDTPSRNFDFNTERDNDSDVWEYRSGSGRCDDDRRCKTWKSKWLMFRPE